MRQPRDGGGAGAASAMSKPTRWHPHPAWWYGLGGAAVLPAAAIGLKYLLGGKLRPHDVLPCLGGAAWFAVSADLGRLRDRGRRP